MLMQSAASAGASALRKRIGKRPPGRIGRASGVLDATGIGARRDRPHPSNTVTRTGSPFRARRRPYEVRSPSMRPRIVVLLCLTIVSGLVAGFVGQATAGKRKASSAQAVSLRFGRCPIPTRFRPAFEQADRETHLGLPLLAAVASVESTFNPNARSPAGAHGLFQVLPSTADDLKIDISTPERNIIAGARYLKMLLDQFQSTDLMLAAYNAGPTAVLKAGGAPNAASRAYVREVEQLWRALNG